MDILNQTDGFSLPFIFQDKEDLSKFTCRFSMYFYKTNGFCLEFDALSQELIDDFLSLFQARITQNSDCPVTILSCLQLVTDEMRNGFIDFANKYFQGDKQKSSYFKLKKIVDEKLVLGSYFVFFPGELIKNDPEWLAKVEALLIDINENIPPGTTISQFNAFFSSDIINNYHIQGATGDKLQYFGELEKSKRVCRYCGRREPDINFKKKLTPSQKLWGMI